VNKFKYVFLLILWRFVATRQFFLSRSTFLLFLFHAGKENVPLIDFYFREDLTNVWMTSFIERPFDLIEQFNLFS
jgi:hypothetical protein